MNPEDDTEVSVDLHLIPRDSNANESGDCEKAADEIDANNVAKSNEVDDPSNLHQESQESCSRMYLEDNRFVMELPGGSGDAIQKPSSPEQSTSETTRFTFPSELHPSATESTSNKEIQIPLPESSKSFKSVGRKLVNRSEVLDSNGKSCAEKELEQVSFVDGGKSKRGMLREEEGDDNRVSVDESRSSSDTTDSSKRQKTGDSPLESKDNSQSKFLKLKSKVRKRNYRLKQNLQDDDNADNSDEIANNESNSEEMETGEAANSPSDEDLSSPVNEDSNFEVETIADIDIIDNGEENSDVDEDDEDGGDDESNDRTSASEDDSDDQAPPVLCKEKPKPQWFVVPEVISRQLGSNRLFQRRFYGSLHTVQRLELMYKLEEHKGCVNTLSFNQRGNLLASGSDDLNVVIWDWPLGKKHHWFKTGHRSNVFQASWLPLPSENLMVTCARDGYVRLADLHKSSVDCSRRLASHEGPATKLSIHPNVPHVILSVGEDAKVFAIDVRQSKPTTLVTVKEGLLRVAIYSVNSNPLNSDEFCLGGHDQFVRIYDKRKASSPMHKLCPENLKNNKINAYVTCAMYNYNGSEIVASYNDEDIYLFDNILPISTGDFAHKYQGHRNNATVKGVNFFGPKSEFVISGSDCGNIYIWEKNTEAIVQWMAGDEYGVVNRLEPHPHIPVLATSGLDYDVKVWVPSCEEPPSMKNLETCVKRNMKSRARDVSREPDAFDGQLLWFLWRHATEGEELRGRAQELRRRAGAARAYAAVDTSSDDTSNQSNSPSEDESDGRPQCSPS